MQATDTSWVQLLTYDEQLELASQLIQVLQRDGTEQVRVLMEEWRLRALGESIEG